MTQTHEPGQNLAPSTPSPGRVQSNAVHFPFDQELP
jgi:hypothetical protein